MTKHRNLNLDVQLLLFCFFRKKIGINIPQYKHTQQQPQFFKDQCCQSCLLLMVGVSSCVTVKIKGQSKFTWPSEVTPLAAVTPFKWTGKGPNTEVSVQKGAHFVWHYTHRFANWTDCFESVPKTKWKILEVLLAQQRTCWVSAGVLQFFLSFHSVPLFLPVAFVMVMEQKQTAIGRSCM